jgi:hypothetical protein
MSEQLAPAEKISLRDIGVKATVVIGAGNLMGITGVNGLAAISFIQLFDALIANVTLGTTNPDYEFPVPASVGTVLPFSACGVKFRTGIVVGVTTTEKGATGVGAGFQGFFFVQQ